MFYKTQFKKPSRGLFQQLNDGTELKQLIVENDLHKVNEIAKNLFEKPENINIHNESQIQQILAFWSKSLMMTFEYDKEFQLHKKPISLWDSLLLNPNSVEIVSQFDPQVAKFIYKVCWLREWKDTIHNLPCACDHTSLLPLVAEIAVFCAMHVPDLRLDLYKNFDEIINGLVQTGPTQLPVAVYISIIEGFGVLSKTQELCPKVTSDLLKLLGDNTLIFQEIGVEDAEQLRQCICTVLAAVLKNSDDSALTKSSLFSLIKDSQTIDLVDDFKKQDVYKRAHIVMRNSLSAIASIVPILRSKDVIEIVFPALARRLDGSDRQWDDLVWETLGNIALLTNDITVYEEVVSLLLERSKKNFNKLSRISRTLARVVDRPMEFQDIYLTKILNFLLDRADYTMANSKDTSLVDDIKDISSILMYLCDQITSTEDSRVFTSALDEKFLLLFRDLWIYIILIILPHVNGVWPKEWTRVLSSVAAATPALLLTKDKTHLEADLLSSSVLGITKVPDSTVNKLRALLISIIPSKSQEIKNSSAAVVIYLLSVYNLELFRVRRKHSVDYILQYLADDRNSEHLDLLERVADELLNYHLEDQQRDISSIKDHLRSLIVKSAHFMVRVRAFCARRIDVVLARFPQMLWNKYLVHLMIDVLRFLDCNDANIREKLIEREQLYLSFKFVDGQSQYAALDDTLRLCTRWLKKALKTCPKEIGGLFQSYTSLRFIELFAFVSPEESRLSALFRSFCSDAEFSSSLVSCLIKQGHYIGEIRGMIEALRENETAEAEEKVIHDLTAKMKQSLEGLLSNPNISQEKFAEAYSNWLHRTSAILLLEKTDDTELLALICSTTILPRFNSYIIEVSVSVWSWVMSSKPSLSSKILARLIGMWEISAIKRLGMYEEDEEVGPFYSKMTYAPSLSPANTTDPSAAHMVWIEFLHERLLVLKHADRSTVDLLVQLVCVFHSHMDKVRINIASRAVFFSLMSLMFKILEILETSGDFRVSYYRYIVYSDAFLWFSHPPMWGATTANDKVKLVEFYQLIKNHKIDKKPQTYHKVFIQGQISATEPQSLLIILMEHEINRAVTWTNGTDYIQESASTLPLAKFASLCRIAWAVSPLVALYLPTRYTHTSDVVSKELSELIHQYPTKILQCPVGINQLLAKKGNDMRFLLMWTPISPIDAICLLGTDSTNHPWIIQYAIRVLEYFPVDQVFFYIPQIVQSLRYDDTGFIEKFILSTAKTSQLFAHQIIWNMKANMYRDDTETVEDSLKPSLDRIIDKIVGSVSGSDKEFYEREFRFFSQVTGISGTLKQYLQCTKVEKKARIDEEMLKIKVDVGVYLPSNPESIVVGIDYKSGRPLQSHAKTPFMATFKIKKATENYAKRMSIISQTESSSKNETFGGTTQWQQCIFKVGDDCRQDILALQLVCIFKSIFEKAGLDMYLFPYRIVATNPGCGVIEVVPNSISRDMMGREKVNSLFDYFLAHYGSPSSMAFEEAQLAFVKSLAPYSLIIYLLQIKDRHNGNILFDEFGHIVHIDFGFILDISPGGINFESSPFKLTTEMIQVLGGDANTLPYQRFQDLIVKGYLACRPYANEIISIVQLMADSGLPCFKGESTIKKLRDRFQLDRNEKSAAEFITLRIRDSHENTRSKLYDGFQFLQNGIPH